MIGVNLVVLTVFLWHLTAAILLIGLLDAVGTLPTPAVDTATWWAWRVPWLLLLGAVLAVLVAIFFGPVEARSGRHRTRRPTLRGTPARSALAVAGYAAVVAALLVNSTAPQPEPRSRSARPSRRWRRTWPGRACCDCSGLGGEPEVEAAVATVEPPLVTALPRVKKWTRRRRRRAVSPNREDFQPPNEWCATGTGMGR